LKEICGLNQLKNNQPEAPMAATAEKNTAPLAPRRAGRLPL